jgi:hypothetical protein
MTDRDKAMPAEPLRFLPWMPYAPASIIYKPCTFCGREAASLSKHWRHPQSGAGYSTGRLNTTWRFRAWGKQVWCGLCTIPQGQVNPLIDRGPDGTAAQYLENRQASQS